MNSGRLKVAIFSIGFLGCVSVAPVFAATEAPQGHDDPSVKTFLRSSFSNQSEVDAQIIEDLKATGEFKKTKKQEGQSQTNTTPERNKKKSAEQPQAYNEVLPDPMPQTISENAAADEDEHVPSEYSSVLKPTRSAQASKPKETQLQTIGGPEKAVETESAFEPNFETTAAHDSNSTFNNTSNSTDLEIVEFVLAKNVAGREPQEIVENYTANDEKAYAYARLNVRHPGQVTFIWSREGRVCNRFTTNVQEAKRFRTYSASKLRPGNWKVQLAVGDKVLSEVNFIVEDTLHETSNSFPQE